MFSNDTRSPSLLWNFLWTSLASSCRSLAAGCTSTDSPVTRLMMVTSSSPQPSSPAARMAAVRRGSSGNPAIFLPSCVSLPSSPTAPSSRSCEAEQWRTAGRYRAGTCRSAATISSPPGASMKSNVVKSWTPQCSHTPDRPRSYLDTAVEHGERRAGQAAALDLGHRVLLQCSVMCGRYCILTSSWLY